LMPGAMRFYSLQVRQQLIWWFCFEICKQRSLEQSFVAAGVCVISADTSSRLRHKISTHARTSAFGLRRSLRAGSQGRRTDWQIAAHDVTAGWIPLCGLQQSGTGTVGPNLEVIVMCPVPRTRRLSGISVLEVGPPGFVVMYWNSPFSSPLSSVHVCWYDCVHHVMLPAKLNRYLHCTLTFSIGGS
jgi:hypothetical protein